MSSDLIAGLYGNDAEGVFVKDKRWVLVLKTLALWIWHVQCNHEHTAALAVCTGPVPPNKTWH